MAKRMKKGGQYLDWDNDKLARGGLLTTRPKKGKKTLAVV